jgi:hypothetical protein
MFENICENCAAKFKTDNEDEMFCCDDCAEDYNDDTWLEDED